MSALEAFCNAAIGFAVSWAATVWLFPLWGFEPSGGQAFGITAAFFCLSFARAYIIRRIFAAWKN